MMKYKNLVTIDMIARRLANQINIEINESREICNNLLYIIEKCMIDGETIAIQNFGKLIPTTSSRKESTLNGNKYKMHSKKSVRFHIGSRFRKILNGEMDFNAELEDEYDEDDE